MKTYQRDLHNRVFKVQASHIPPSCSPVGSNAWIDDNNVYQAFTKYYQEAARGGRRDVSLNHILLSVAGKDEEPPIGFIIPSMIKITSVADNEPCSYVLTANTHSDTMHTCISGILQ